MDKNIVFEQLKERVEKVDTINGTLKFVVDGKFGNVIVFIVIIGTL